MQIKITNQTDLCELSVLSLIKTVIEQGRISNNGKNYCWVTAFNVENPITGIKKEIQVIADRTKTMDTFKIIEKLTEKQ